VPSVSELLGEAQEHHHAGRLKEAQDLYAHIVEQFPEHGDALNLLGTVLAQRGRFEQASSFIRRAIQAKPKRPAYHCNLGVVLLELGRYDQARASFDRTIKLDREFTEAYYNLGKLYKQMDLIDPALMAYQQVLSIEPERIDAKVNMGNILFDAGRLDEAIDYFQQAIDGNPDAKQIVRALINLGNTYRRRGDDRLAIETYEKVFARRDHGGLKIKQATTLPIVCQSWDHIQDVRERYNQRVQKLLDGDVRVTDPLLETSTTTFFLAYHGLGDRQLQEKVAQLHLKSCPELAYLAPHCRNLQPLRSKIRIGFISAYFRRHSIGRLMQGLIAKISRDQFDVVVFTTPGQRDPVARAIEGSADQMIKLPDGLAAARDAIAEAEVDILFYADIGMDVRTYFLAFARLAPVQCVTWGHPDTTGIPNLDYFISSELLEPEGAEDAYSETLHKLKTLPTYYHRPTLRADGKSRQDFGFEADAHIYLCPQSAIKHHPDLDIIFAGILDADPKARIIVVEGAVADWTSQVRDRMKASHGDAINRVSVVPRMSPEEFLELIAAADVILDTPHFSGGNTSFEAFALAKAVVTLPGDFMRGRVTQAMYRMMDIADCVADGLDNYVEIAVKLGCDASHRNAIEKQIEARNECLFEESKAVLEFERFFHMATKRGTSH